MSKVILLILVTFLVGCESMTPLGMAKKAIGLGGAASGGIEVSPNIGKEIKDEDSVVKVVGETSDIKAEKITGGINKTTIQEIPMEFMLLMVLGWMLPSPSEIWRGFTNLFRRRKP